MCIFYEKKSEAFKPRLAHAARAYPAFRSMKRLGVFLLSLDGMLVHRRSLPRNLSGFPNNLLVPIYTPGWREALRELPKNTTQCPRPGIEPGLLAPGTNALTIRPLRHDLESYKTKKKVWIDQLKQERISTAILVYTTIHIRSSLNVM